MWEHIELREIRVFLALAEELHFGRSAERLSLTQSRVSQSLRGLERKLGGRLVYRTSRTVRLTAFGKRFLAEISVVHEQLAGVLRRAEAAGRALKRTIRIGLMSGIAAGPHFLQIVKAFEERHPEVVIETEENFPDLFGPLRRGEVSVLATWLPHGQSDVVVGPILAVEPRVLAVGRGHLLTERTHVSMEDVADFAVAEFPTVPKEFLQVWIPSRTPSGRPIPRRRIENDSINQVAFLVVAGKIVHPTVPSAVNYWGHPDITYIPITDLPPMRSALIWQRGLRDPLIREFIQTAREVTAPSLP